MILLMSPTDGSSICILLPLLIKGGVSCAKPTRAEATKYTSLVLNYPYHQKYDSGTNQKVYIHIKSFAYNSQFIIFLNWSLN